LKFCFYALFKVPLDELCVAQEALPTYAAAPRAAPRAVRSECYIIFILYQDHQNNVLLICYYRLNVVRASPYL